MIPVSAGQPYHQQMANSGRPGSVAPVGQSLPPMHQQLDYSKVDPQALAAAMALLQQGQAQFQQPATQVLNIGPQMVTFSDGSTFRGDVDERGAPHGKGTLIYANHPDRSRCEGDFVNGKAHGVCQVIYKSGNVYDGEMKNDMRHGRGVLNYLNNESKKQYDGMWEEDQMTNGTMTFLGNFHYMEYKGQFKNNIPHGQGTASSRISGQSEGEWVNGKFWNGTNYHGTYVNGELQRNSCCTIL